MRKNLLLILLVCVNMLYGKVSHAQEIEPIVEKIINFPTTFFGKVHSKYSNLEDRITKQTSKYLQCWPKRKRR